MVQAIKKDTVKKFVKLLETYPVVGALNLQNLPGAQLGKMRTQLRGKVEIVMTKKRLIKKAIEQVKDKKPGIEKLEEQFKGMPAIIFTKENPFSLFKTIKKSKSKAAAKPGQIAPYDLKISAGPTPFAPGPMISEFAQLGIKTKVDQGKIAVINDSVLVKEGEAVSDKAANMLSKLGVEPMEIGLDLVAVYEDGTIYTKEVLDVDEEEFKQSLTRAASWALNLAVEAGYTTKDTIEILLGKAYRATKAVALEANILVKDVVGDVIAKAERQMQALKAMVKK